MGTSIALRVEAIRQWLDKNQLDAIIIPHEDEYLGEYLPERNERLLWATGFKGSAGVAVITRDNAAIFVDGRYTVQVTKQVPSDIFTYRHLIEEPIQEWLLSEKDSLSRVGYDPRLHTGNWLDKINQSVSESIDLIALESNPIDLLWENRPLFADSMARLLPVSAVGLSCEAKRLKIAEEIKSQSADAAIITQLDSICWLLNIRGEDVSRLPVLLSHAIIFADGSLQFFFDSKRLPGEFAHHAGRGVTVLAPSKLKESLASLGGKTILLDSSSANSWFKLQLDAANAHIIPSADPCVLIKAIKNHVEADGMRACHIQDGASMVRFLSWLDSEVDNGNELDEALLSDRLQAFRQQDPTLIDLSFDTISAAGENAAMCHYNHADQQHPGKLTKDSLYLVDSGGQYLGGTTDITRTVAIGCPSYEMKKQFTLVLKGHISLASALFPKGTTGHQLDVLARQHLWQNGYDYDHGTGHGVGHFLNVHEGPQNISKVARPVPLEAGMVVSNEPGYYRAQSFGIRIENLEIVVDKKTTGDFDCLGFESLTRCPIDKRNVCFELLTSVEIEWLDNYHKKVWDDVSPMLEEAEKTWLAAATSPLSI